MSSSLVSVIVGYAVGFLAFPFFWSFSTGWPFAKARLDADDTLFVFLLCVLWPVVLLAVLVAGWWCALSGLGERARRLCDKLVGKLERKDGK